jgi:hypothetical protein
MMRAMVQRWLWLFVCIPPLLVGCGHSNEQGTPAPAHREKPIPKEVLDGSVFHQYFPAKPEGPFTLSYEPDQKGLATALLKKNGKDVAKLIVRDTLLHPEETKPYQDTKKVLGGYPMIITPEKGVALLLGGRFQVEVRPINDSFTEEECKEWLKLFDLETLSRLA